MSLSRVLLMFVFAVLAACSGSDNQTPPITGQPPVEKGIEGGGIVSRVSGGKVTVSGTEFDLPNTGLIVTINDEPGAIQNIDVGYFVTVKATTTDDGVTATASSIDYLSDVNGPIEAGSIDLVGQSFVVLGQTILVTPETVFSDNIDPRSVEGLNDGDVVEISGLRNGDEAVVAGRIAMDGIRTLQVRGIVSSLQPNNFSFNISDLVVDYSAAVLEDFDSGEPSEGDFVDAEGDTLGGNDELLASRVKFKNRAFTGEDGDLAEIEGFITDFVSLTEFNVAGRPVTTNPQTTYEDGTEADLAPNVRVDVDGTLDINGVLVANRIEFKTGAEQAKNKLSGVMESIDKDADSLEVFGITIQADAFTRIEDKSDASVRLFDFDDLDVDDFVEIRGFEEPIGSRIVTAVLLEREDLDDRILQGFVESATEPDFQILGVTIRTDGTTQFEDTNDMVISAAEFFAAVSQGSLVKAKGDYNGTEIIAREVELEN